MSITINLENFDNSNQAYDAIYALQSRGFTVTVISKLAWKE